MSTGLLECGEPLWRRSPERVLERRALEGDLDRRERFACAFPSRLGDAARAERRGEAERRGDKERLER